MAEDTASWKRTVAVGLAFFILTVCAYIAVQVMKRFGAGHEPLTPVEKREAGTLVMPVLALENRPAATGPGVVETWSLAEQKGKVVMVNYFATWCGPCVEEAAELARLAKEYAGKGVVTVGVSMDRDEDRVGGEGTRVKALKQFVERNQVGYPILAPAEGSVLWKVEFPIPQTFLYDKQGRRARVIVGGIEGGDLRGALEELLGE